MNKLDGINAGIIRAPQGVVAMALKFNTKNQKQHLVYLPPEQLQSLLFATFSGYRMLMQLYQQTPDSIRVLVINEENILNKKIPSLNAEELKYPNIDLQVTDFVMKTRDGKINMLFFLKNSEVLPLEITYAQTEFMLSLFLKTIQNAADAGFMAFCLSANDFLPLYTSDFNTENGMGINYNRYLPPEWKNAVFDTFHSIIYVHSNGYVSCGAIIKGVPYFERERIESIARFILDNNSSLSVYKDKNMVIDYVRLDITTEDATMDTLLRAHLAHRDGKLN